MEYLDKNPDPTADFWHSNAKGSLCGFCEARNTCIKSDDYPKISPLTSHILRWCSEINAGIPRYPLDGGWDRQPVWFGQCLSIVRATEQRIRDRELDKMRNKS